MTASDPYVVQYDSHVVKELKKIDKSVARRILGAVDALGVDPRPAGSRPLVGHPTFGESESVTIE